MISKEKIIEKLKEVKDPELDIDIYTLGLIYDITINDEGVAILMTLTTPFCPYGNEIVTGVEDKLKDLKVPGVRVDVTFDPPWEPSEDLRAILGV